MHFLLDLYYIYTQNSSIIDWLNIKCIRFIYAHIMSTEKILSNAAYRKQ